MKTLIRFRLPVLVLAGLTLTSCAWKKDLDKAQAENKALTEEKARSQKELSAAGAATAEMQGTLDEVQKGLEELRVKELKAIKTSITVAQEGKSAASAQREELKAEIEDIRKAVRANLDKLATLQKSLKASDAKVTSLERLVGELRRQLDEKEATIAALEEKTKELTKTTEELRGTVKEKEEAVQQKEATIAGARGADRDRVRPHRAAEGPQEGGPRREEGIRPRPRRQLAAHRPVRRDPLQADRHAEGHDVRGRGRPEQGAGPFGPSEGQLHARVFRPEGEHAHRHGPCTFLEGKQVPRRDAA